MRKRGRPKGHEITVVGLPLKKSACPKLVPFLKLHTSTKEKGKINTCTYYKTQVFIAIIAIIQSCCNGLLKKVL